MRETRAAGGRGQSRPFFRFQAWLALQARGSLSPRSARKGAVCGRRRAPSHRTKRFVRFRSEIRGQPAALAELRDSPGRGRRPGCPGVDGIHPAAMWIHGSHRRQRALRPGNLSMFCRPNSIGSAGFHASRHRRRDFAPPPARTPSGRARHPVQRLPDRCGRGSGVGRGMVRRHLKTLPAPSVSANAPVRARTLTIGRPQEAGGGSLAR